jgi:hypothetical protein
MARMYPERLPRLLTDDPLRSAEARVYARLGEGLDDDFTVMHGVSYLVDGNDGHRHDGEIDFLVGHADQGLLVIEVKGGGIAHDTAAGTWTSRDRSGAVHPIKDPIDQARRHKYDLSHWMKELPGWARRRVPMTHAALFPDSARPPRDLGPDAPLSILGFAEDMEYLGDWTRGLLAGQAGGAGEFGAAALEELVRRLAPRFQLRMPLGPALREDERRLVELTEQQFHVLSQLARMPRVIISGGAGTGKTFLALEQAQRLAREGLRTLLTCFNTALAGFLRASAGEGANLTIWNFHQLCYRWARRAGLRAVDPDGPLAATQKPEYFEQRLPGMLLKALGRLPERFDALLVDEAQDFIPSYWRCLELLLADPAAARVYVFRDEAQDVFGGGGATAPRPGAALLDGLPEFRLIENCRNTRSIHAVARALADDDTRALGPEGRPPEFIVVDEAGERARLAEVVTRLVRGEGVPPEQIAVLTASRKRLGALAPLRSIGEYPTTADTGGVAGHVLLETIHRFKGLERPVVILAGLRRPATHVDPTKLLYVGVSRAQTYLVVLGDEETVGKVRGNV